MTDRIVKISYMTDNDYLYYQIDNNCQQIEFVMAYSETRDTGEISEFCFMYDIYIDGLLHDVIEAKDVLVVEYESGEVAE